MTLPDERITALYNAFVFMNELLDTKKTPRIPRAIRQRAYWVLRHYPTVYEINAMGVELNNPKYLTELILDKNTGDATKAIALSNLGSSMRSECFDFLKKHTKHESPNVRDGAYSGLANYLESDNVQYSNLHAYLREALSEEKDEDIRTRIRALLKSIKLYVHG